jgi:hypothetical protein
MNEQEYLAQQHAMNLSQMGSQANNLIRVDGKDPNFLQWFLESKEGIENLKFIWRGFERDEKGSWYKPDDGIDRRQMNEHGIHWATSVMESYLDKVFQTSNFNDEHMNFEMRQAYRVVWYGLATQWTKFGLTKINVQVVATAMLAKIHAMLLAARAEGIRALITKTQSISEVKTSNPQDNRGFMSGISSLFRRNQPSGGGY